jgi:hypothetical protein
MISERCAREGRESLKSLYLQIFANRKQLSLVGKAPKRGNKN